MNNVTGYVLQRIDRQSPAFVSEISNDCDNIGEALIYNSWEEAVEILSDRNAFTEEEARNLLPRPIRIELL